MLLCIIWRRVFSRKKVQFRTWLMDELNRSLLIQIQYACGQCVFKVKGRHKFSQSSSSSSVGLCHHRLCYWVIFSSLEHISNVIIPNWLCFVNIDCVTLQLSHSCCVRFFDRINRIESEVERRMEERNWFCRAKRAKKPTRKTVRQNDCALFKRFIYSDVKVHVRHHEPQWMCVVWVVLVNTRYSILFFHAMLGIDCFALHPFDTYTIFCYTTFVSMRVKKSIFLWWHHQ